METNALEDVLVFLGELLLLTFIFLLLPVGLPLLLLGLLLHVLVLLDMHIASQQSGPRLPVELVDLGLLLGDQHLFLFLFALLPRRQVVPTRRAFHEQVLQGFFLECFLDIGDELELEIPLGLPVSGPPVDEQSQTLFDLLNTPLIRQELGRLGAHPELLVLPLRH